MKKRIMAVLLAVSTMIATTACGGGGSSFEKGSMDGKTYTNKSVGITVTIPDGFELADQATIDAMEEASKSNSNLSDKQVDKAFSAITYEVVAQAADGSAIQIIAEDMKQTIGRAASTKEYMNSMKSQIKSQYGAMGLSAEVSELGQVKVGGKDFDGITIDITGGTQELKQTYYIYKVGNFMYCIILTATGDQISTLDQFLSSFAAVE